MSVSLLKVVADLNLSLASAVSAGATTATLNTAVDSDGVALPSGKYGFTVDGDNASKEFFVCDLVGTALTNVQSISKQGAATTGFSTYHRTGAVVTITDWTVWKRAIDNLTGVTGFDADTPLNYDAEPSYSDPLTIPTVQYVLDTVNGGPVTFDALVIAGDAGETIVDGDWVYFDTSDGEWYKTDADDTAKSLGVRIGKARGAGTNGNPITSGIFTDGLEKEGTYVAGTIYYLSNTAGALSTSAGTNSVVVGVGDANGDLILRQPTANQVDAMQGGGLFGNPSSSNKFLTESYIPALNRFGNGSDGAATISSGTTTLTRDMYYTDLTVNGTGILATAGYRVYVSGTLTVDNTSGAQIRNNGGNGGNASANTAGTAGAIAPGVSVPAGLIGFVGATGRTTIGTGATGTNGGSSAFSIGVVGVAGGAGGDGNGQAAGSATTAGAQTVVARISHVGDLAFARILNGTITAFTGSSGSGSGSAGGQGAAGTSGGGGGSGATGGVLLIFAKTVVLTGTACLSAIGGNGGNGGNASGSANGGGGGGGGGAGGLVILVYSSLTGSSSNVSAAGGTAGTGGTGGGGGGNAGSNGTAGTTGIALLLNI